MNIPWMTRALIIGYDLTSDVEYCKIQLCKIFDCKKLVASDISKFIGFMIRTRTNFLDYDGLETLLCRYVPGYNNATSSGSQNQKCVSTKTWRPEIFIYAVKQLVPSLSWMDVYFQLDHANFIIKDRAGLEFLLNIARLGNGNFPVKIMYRYWRNINGQFSLVSQILKNPDLFSFGDNITNILPLESLPVQPDMNNKEIAQWKCIDLIAILIYFSNNGYAEQVSEILKFPTEHCPDLLCLAIIYINPPMTKFREDLFAKLIKKFFPNLPNSGKILHHAWNTKRYSTILRPIILSSLTEWYLSDESISQLPRVLEIAVYLEALKIFLNSSSYEFVLDLACIASVTYYIDMENWLSEKLVVGGEPFVAALIIYLQCHSTHTADENIVGSKMKKVFQLREETVSIIVKCLQDCIGLVNINLSYRIAEITGAQPIVQKQPVCTTLEDALPSVVLIQDDALDSISLSSNDEHQIFDAITAGVPSQLDFRPGASENVVSLPSITLSEPSSTHHSTSVMANDSPNVNNLTPFTSCDTIHEPLTLSEVSELVQSFSKETDDEAIQTIYNNLLDPHLMDGDLEILKYFEEFPQQQLDLQQQQEKEEQQQQQYQHQQQQQQQQQQHQQENQHQSQQQLQDQYQHQYQQQQQQQQQQQK